MERASFLVCCDVVSPSEFLETELSTTALEKVRLLLEMPVASLVGEECTSLEEDGTPGTDLGHRDSNEITFSHFTPLWWKIFSNLLKNDSHQVFVVPFGAAMGGGECEGIIRSESHMRSKIHSSSSMPPHSSLDGSAFVPHAYQLVTARCGTRNRTRLFLLGRISSPRHGEDGAGSMSADAGGGGRFQRGDIVVKLFEYIDGSQGCNTGGGGGDRVRRDEENKALEKGRLHSRAMIPNGSSSDELAVLLHQSFQGADGNGNVWLPTGTVKLSRSSHDDEVAAWWPTAVHFCPEEDVLLWSVCSSHKKNKSSEDKQLWCAPLHFSVQRQHPQPQQQQQQRVTGVVEGGGVMDEVHVGSAVLLSEFGWCTTKRQGTADGDDAGLQLNFDGYLLANGGIFFFKSGSMSSFVSLQYGQLSEFRHEHFLEDENQAESGSSHRSEELPKGLLLATVHKQTKELFVFSRREKEVFFYAVDSSSKALHKKKVCALTISGECASPHFTEFYASEMLLFFIEEATSRCSVEASSLPHQDQDQNQRVHECHPQSHQHQGKGHSGQWHIWIFYLDGALYRRITSDGASYSSSHSHQNNNNSALWFLQHQRPTMTAALVTDVFYTRYGPTLDDSPPTVIKVATPSFQQQTVHLSEQLRNANFDFMPPEMMVAGNGRPMVSNPSACHALHWSGPEGLLDIDTVKYLMSLCLAEKKFEDLVVLMEHLEHGHSSNRSYHHHHHHHLLHRSLLLPSSPYGESRTAVRHGCRTGVGSRVGSTIAEAADVLRHFSNILDIVSAFRDNNSVAAATAMDSVGGTPLEDVGDELASADDIHAFLCSKGRVRRRLQTAIVATGRATPSAGELLIKTEAGGSRGSSILLGEQQEEDTTVPPPPPPSCSSSGTLQQFQDALSALRQAMPAQHFVYFSSACENVLCLLLHQLTSFYGDGDGDGGLTHTLHGNGGSLLCPENALSILGTLQSETEHEKKGLVIFNSIPHAMADQDLGRAVLSFLETITGVDSLRAYFHKSRDRHKFNELQQEERRKENMTDTIDNFGILLDVYAADDERVEAGDIHLDHILFVPSLDFQLLPHSNAAHLTSDAARGSLDRNSETHTASQAMEGNAYFHCLCLLYYRVDPSFLPFFVWTLDSRRKQHLPPHYHDPSRSSYFDQALEVLGLLHFDKVEGTAVEKKRARAYSQVLEGGEKYASLI
jgi:hypothetical protein